MWTKSWGNKVGEPSILCWYIYALQLHTLASYKNNYFLVSTKTQIKTRKHNLTEQRLLLSIEKLLISYVKLTDDCVLQALTRFMYLEYHILDI